MSFAVVGVAFKDSLLPEQKGAVVTSCGMASLGAGGSSLLFWQYIVLCPCGGWTNSVLLLRRPAPSALARRTGCHPQPHGAAGGGGEAAPAAVCCHGCPRTRLPVVPEWEPAGAPEEKKTLGNVSLG